MVYTKFADFAEEYQSKKLESNNYFGFDLLLVELDKHHPSCSPHKVITKENGIK